MEASVAARHNGPVARARGPTSPSWRLQFAAQQPAFACCLAGSVSPAYLREWVQWLGEPIDKVLLAEVEKILGPALNVSYVEGRPENN